MAKIVKMDVRSRAAVQPARPTVPFSKGDPEAARRLLRKWRNEGDEKDQRETLEFLRRALNQGRPKGYGVFPEP